jgi:coenzyme F420-reducing hydrogenase alpha subunit
VGRTVTIGGAYLTRVEGHGRLNVVVRDGRLETCRLDVVEAPRFFEGMLRGRSVFEAQHITSRICGICSCGHTLASIAAAEDALGIVPTSQTLLLRRLLLSYEILDSHLLHIYFLAAPDVLGVESTISLLGTHEKVVRRALRLKRGINDACDILAGRHVHPITPVVGGFTRLPRPPDLERMHGILNSLRPDLDATLDLVSTFRFPAFSRETEYVALVDDTDQYPLLAGEVGSSDGKRFHPRDYRSVTNEFVVPHSSAKHTRLSRDSYAVGALARYNLNGHRLRPEARAAAEGMGLARPCTNPYLATAAQMAECVHVLAEAILLLEGLLEGGVDVAQELTPGVNESGSLPVRAGSGVGAVEVPRGTLYHHYQVDERGIIQEADCVIPTNQNLNNIERDMQALVPAILDRSDQEIALALEMLVRAYDPCISCSTHFLRLRR